MFFPNTVLAFPKYCFGFSQKLLWLFPKTSLAFPEILFAFLGLFLLGFFLTKAVLQHFFTF